MKVSLTDAAYDYLKAVKTVIPFNELYAIAAEKAALNEELRKRKKNSFYSQLSMDSRFTQCENNTWDLKEHHSFEETHIKVESLDADDEEETEETELNEEMSEDEDDEENEAVDDPDDDTSFEDSEEQEEF